MVPPPCLPEGTGLTHTLLKTFHALGEILLVLSWVLSRKDISHGVSWKNWVRVSDRSQP